MRFAKNLILYFSYIFKEKLNSLEIIFLEVGLPLIMSFIMFFMSIFVQMIVWDILNKDLHLNFLKIDTNDCYFQH